MFSNSLCLSPSLRLKEHKSKRKPSCTISNIPVTVIKCSDIVPTEIVDFIKNPWGLPDVPICVIPYKNRYIIADGNHRFCADQQIHKETTKAWILMGKNKRSISESDKGGIAQWLRRWRDGQISYKELKEELKQRAKDIGVL